MKPAAISLAAILAVVAGAASAQSAPVASSRTVPAQVQNSADAVLDERLARDWGLRPEEWARYRQLMQGPLGVYSPNLDPLTALGIEARSDEERNRYAELQVQAESKRVGKTLAYQRAYDAAWKRLYPGQQRVDMPGAKAPGAGNRGRAGWRFREGRVPAVRAARAPVAGGRYRLRSLHGRQPPGRHPHPPVGDAGRHRPRVRARTITLNHDAGRWLSLGLPGDLPAVVREVNGQWQRQ